MSTALPLFFLFATISSLLNTGLAQFALARNWCDPPGKAKLHIRPVPFTGGLGIFLVWTIALLLISPPPIHLLPPALLGLLIGTYDDLRWKTASVPGRKFILQAIPAITTAIILTRSLSTYNPFTITLALLLFSLFTLLLINAVNLADGIDGLAGTETLISLIGFAIILANLNHPLSLAALFLAAAITGFLVLNLSSPSRLFLGDGGSHLLGTILAFFSVSIFILRPAIWTAIALLLIIGLPIIDLGWIILFRIYRRRPLFSPDRNHLYDLLSKSGLGPRTTLLILTGVQSLLTYTGIIIALMEI